MTSKIYTEAIAIPSLSDFSSLYPQYAPYANGAGNDLFELIISPKSIVRAKFVTELGYSAVYGVAEECCKFLSSHKLSIDRFTKQFIGAVICCAMEENGYKKTGKKKSISHPEFSKGEFYIEK